MTATAPLSPVEIVGQWYGEVISARARNEQRALSSAVEWSPEFLVPTHAKRVRKPAETKGDFINYLIETNAVKPRKKAQQRQTEKSLAYFVIRPHYRHKVIAFAIKLRAYFRGQNQHQMISFEVD